LSRDWSRKYEEGESGGEGKEIEEVGDEDGKTSDDARLQL